MKKDDNINMEIIQRKNFCRLCDSPLQLVVKLSPTPIGDDYIKRDNLGETQEKYPMDLALCSNCGHLQLLDVVSPKRIYKDYIYTSKSSITLEKHFQAYMHDVVDRINPPMNSLIVDIGSNDGTLLKNFRDENYQILGIDPAKHIAKNATEKGIRTLPSFFTSELAGEIKKSYDSAYIITANNVFANIDNLNQMTENIKILLDDEGVFILESGYAVETMQKTVFDNIHHEHLSYFSVKPLEIFFKKHGMEIIDIVQVSTKGGSIRIFVQFQGGPRKISESVKKFIDYENEIGIHRNEIFKEFEKKIEIEKDKIKKKLKNLKLQGKKIAGFGAAIGSTQLIYNFGISDYIDFIVDDNPLRNGLFSPGFHIPVYLTEEIYKQKPDAIICLAWRYAKPIIEKNKKYLESGGEFIVPFSNPDYEEEFF